MLEKIENLYLNFFRYALIILATLSIVLGGVNLIVSLYKLSSNPIIEKAISPDWSEIKFEVLPIKKVEQKRDEGIESKDKKKDALSIDSRILTISNNLDELFENKSLKFSDKYPLETLEKKFQLSSISNLNEGIYLNGLKDLSLQIGQEKRFLQISDAEGRIEIIDDTLDYYFVLFQQEEARVEFINDLHAEKAFSASEEGKSQILFSLFAGLAFIIILLIILTFKVELNLRKIAPAIIKKE